jgi:hypothetical protein
MDYTWQRLSDAESALVKAHLGECAACRAELAEETALGNLLALMPPVAPRRDLWDTVRLRKMALDIPLPPDAARASRLHPAIRGWTAAVAVGAAALALMLLPGSPPKQPASSARVLAQTLDTARQVTRQSDDPLGDISNSTWDALSLPETSSS